MQGTYTAPSTYWISLGMMIAIVPLVFTIVGLLMWVLASNPLIKEAGRLIFFAAFLALMLACSGQGLSLGGDGRIGAHSSVPSVV